MAGANAKAPPASGYTVSATAEMLRQAALATGDPAFLQALRALLARPLGRNDSTLVAEGVWLVETGKAKTPFAAATMVARTITTDERAEHAIAVRVCRKIEAEIARRKNITSGL